MARHFPKEANMAKQEQHEHPTPTQAELDAIKRGETGVTDTAENDGEEKDVTADKPAAYKTRQAKAD